MIHLSAPLFDPDGAITINESPASEITGISRRMNRIKTLDGGVAVNDRGHSPGDRDFRIRWRPRTEVEYMAVQRLVRLYPRLNVSTREGVFTVAPQSIDIRSGEATLTLLVLEQQT